jgi:hypothetical protein
MTRMIARTEMRSPREAIGRCFNMCRKVSSRFLQEKIPRSERSAQTVTASAASVPQSRSADRCGRLAGNVRKLLYSFGQEMAFLLEPPPG